MCMLRQGCSLSMLHRTCKNMHGGVRLCGLGMPNILHMPFYFKPRGIKKYSIPMWCKLNLPIFLLKSWIVGSNVDGFFNCSGNAMVHPPYYLEVVLCGGATVVVYGEGSFRCSLNLSPKVLEVSPMDS